jgi:hypothetical protein
LQNCTLASTIYAMPACPQNPQSSITEGWCTKVTAFARQAHRPACSRQGCSMRHSSSAQTGWPTAGEKCCKVPNTGFSSTLTLGGVPSEENAALFHHSLATAVAATGEQEPCYGSVCVVALGHRTFRPSYSPGMHPAFSMRRVASIK